MRIKPLNPAAGGKVMKIRRLAIIGLTLAGVLCTASVASAKSCEEHAAICMSKGGTIARCYGPAVQQCKQTNQYVGPYSGKVFRANGPKKRVN